MAEFTKLSEVPEVEEFPEGGKVLINDNGTIKQCEADGLGGGGGKADVVIKYIRESDLYQIEGLSFSETKERILNHNPVQVDLFYHTWNSGNNDPIFYCRAPLSTSIWGEEESIRVYRPDNSNNYINWRYSDGVELLDNYEVERIDGGDTLL